jgi:hypothetical protein
MPFTKTEKWYANKGLLALYLNNGWLLGKSLYIVFIVYGCLHSVLE